MLKWALIFLIVALVAGVLGFGGIAGSAVGIAQILFWAFIIITAVLFLIGLVSGRKTI
ncbi:DUF1328 domain-containing protein [bacterium]|nr:MAG: DUF1328 domain-containing protein [bacterium]